MTRKQSLGVSLAPKLIQLLDELVKVDDQQRTRNELIGEAVSQYVTRRRRDIEPDAKGKRGGK